MCAGFLDQPVPFGIAHQGGHEVAPGNTMAAFEHAVALGYRYIETDVQVTADGVLVVYHDDDLAPGTGRPRRIGDLSWEEVSQLRVGGEHPIPRFDDVVERFADVRFNVEPKNDASVDPLVAAIGRHDLLSRICVGSFSDRRLARMRSAVGPGLCRSPGPVATGAILLAAVVWPRWRPPYAALQIPRRQWGIPLVNRWIVGRYHRMGLQVHVWTINDEHEMRRLFDDGVDAIMSDKVSTLRRVLDEWSAPA